MTIDVSSITPSESETQYSVSRTFDSRFTFLSEDAEAYALTPEYVRRPLSREL